MVDWKQQFMFTIDGEPVEFELWDRGIEGFEEGFHKFKLTAMSALPNTDKRIWTITWIVKKQRWVNNGDVAVLRERTPALSDHVMGMINARTGYGL